MVRKEIPKEVYDAIMLLDKFCQDSDCDTCPFYNKECMPNFSSCLTEENGKCYVIDYTEKGGGE